MKVARYSEKGPAKEVLKILDLDQPAPQKNEVLVRVKASGVNPSDVKSRGGGGRKQAFDWIIPHSDGAGIIEGVGGGIDIDRIGERVWLWNAQWKRSWGTAAEYVCVPSEQAVKLPDSTDFSSAACIGIPLLTALQALRLSRVKPGDTLYVSGGAGAVSQYAIQIAAHRGVHVITSVSTTGKSEASKEAGAQHILNYRKDDLGSRVHEITDGSGVDAVLELDLTENAKLLPAIVKPHGTVVAYGMSNNEPVIPGRWMLQQNIDLRLFLVYELSRIDRDAGLKEVGELLSAGALTHRIGGTYPLEDIAAAHERVENGIIGNVVIEM